MRPLALTLTVALASLLLFAPPASAGSDWRWPVRGPVITPYRNGADPYAGGQHRGIDIGAPAGTPVVAATAGTVTYAGLAGSSGLTVAVRTDDGRFDTSYLHLSSVEVAKGDRVAGGDGIGAVGTTGRRSAAEPHLHFGVRDADTRFAYRDPLDFLPLAPPVSDPAPRAVPAPVALPVRPLATPATALAAAIGTPLAEVAAPVAAAARAGLGASPAPMPAPAPSGRVRTGMAPVGRLSSATLPSAPRVAGSRSSIARHGDPRRATAVDGTAPLPALGPNGAGGAETRPGATRPTRIGLGARHARGSVRPTTRPDIGWLAACLGLVAASLALGRPARTARSLRRGLELRPAALRSPGEQAG